MRAYLIPAVIAASLAGPTLAQAPDASKVRAAYERLCTGDAPGSVATCEALRSEMDKAGVPGTRGWSGVLVGAPDDGTKAARVYAVDPRGPGAAAGLRTGDSLVAVDGRPFPDTAAFLKHAETLLANQAITVRVVRGDQILDLPIKLTEPPKPNPTLNAQRTTRGAPSLMKQLNGLSGAALTVDKIRVGEEFYGILEDSDATSDWGKREDCLEVAETAGKNLSAFVTPNGAPMRIYVMQGRCDFGVAATVAASPDAKKLFGINFATQPGTKTYLMVSGASSARPYQVIVREQTPKETLAWRQQVRQNQIAAQQQREAAERAAADRRQMLGAALGGLVLGFSGAEMPAMREDGSAPNLLDTLNAANAALERKNAEGAARLNETIARAQAQGEYQRREQAARAAAETQEKNQQQAQKVAQDRQAATIAFGNARTGIEQKLREAAASGDARQLQHWREQLRQNDALASQYGVTDQVRQYAERQAGQGQLGQTPLSGVPTPTTAPKPQPATQVAQSGAQAGPAKLRCFSPNPDEALVCPEDRARTGGTGGSSGAGGASRVADARTPGQPSAGSGAPSRPVAGQQPPPARPTPVAQTEIRPESVTLCELNGPQAQFKNWTCRGSLQMNYVNFEKPNWQAAMQMTCGTNRAIRDLGTVGGYRAFGCGFPLVANDDVNSADIPARYGISYVPGRMSFRCPKGSTRNCQPA